VTPEARLTHLRRFAHWLDAGIPVPGTGFRFGLDPLLGLIPGLGDAAGGVLAGWMLVEAVRLGVSPATLGRMASNIALDALAGGIPVVGDAFDVVWKANLKNVALLERHAANPVEAGRTDRLFVALLAGGVLALYGALVVGGVALTAWFIRTLIGL
jgi:hypothetical protein